MRKSKKSTPQYMVTQLCTDTAVLDYFRSLNSINSQKSMGYYIKSFVKTALDCCSNFTSWEKLTDTVINIVIGKMLEEQQSPSTINTKLCAIKGVAKRLWVQERLDPKTYQLISEVKNVRGSRIAHGRMLSEYEIQKLFQFLGKQNSFKKVRDAAIFSVMIGTGLRRAEVSKLSMDGVFLDVEKPYLRVIGKGNKERQVPLPKFAIKRLKDWIECRGNFKGRIFVQIRKDETVTEQGLTGCSIYNICNGYVEALGMKHWSPHDLRRTCASKLIDMGFALTSVRDYLGHSSISTTQLYDKSSSNRLNEIADKIKL